jgi:hypothetical protein
MLPSNLESLVVARQAELREQAVHARRIQDARASRRARPHHALELDRFRAAVQWLRRHSRPAARPTAVVPTAH